MPHQIDAKIADLKVRSSTKTPFVQSNFRSPFQNINSNIVHENRVQPTNVRKLTPEEVDHCRKNGLCFHYKEKYVKGHSCERKQLLLIDVQDSALCNNAELEDEEPEITACALFGTPAPSSIQTMKVT